ncbi:MAG: sodium:calcium antiporter [Neoaquamicrobium sediminum]|uniref:sodium:calcium antiporter n=1 Tax=Neoaquamicrobium sediminum TaxID=1849104 RepID=UPI004036691D
MLDFVQLGLPMNMLLFAVAAVAVWLAGARLTGYADAISRITGLGQAVIGIILLAGVTSLPEIGVTATASIAGDAQLAVNNLFGSIALQVALLAVVDLMIGREALTAVVPDPAVMLQGALNVLLLAVGAAAMVAGDVGIFGVGLWAWACLFLYVAAVWSLAVVRGKRPWLAARNGGIDERLISSSERHRHTDDVQSASLRPLLIKTGATAAVILAAGFVLARSGDAIAQASGLGQSFVGFVLVALATSLPELSTALTATRRGLYTMAISDILGTNLINVALLFVVDLLDTNEEVILNRMDDFAVFGALLAIALTAIFLAGLSERRDRSFLRMGYDSIAVMVTYAVGVAILYTLRPDQ